MIFYRYLEARYALDALQTGQWKIGRLNKLNDIFDCRPRLTNHPRGTEAMEEKYLEGNDVDFYGRATSWLGFLGWISKRRLYESLSV